MKKNFLLILGGIILFFFILITSFLWYRLFYGVSNESAVSVLQVNLNKESGAIESNNATPIESEKVQSLTPYVFSVNNTGTTKTIYKIILEEPAISDDISYQSQNLLSRSQLAYQLVLNDKVIKTGMLSDIQNNILDQRSVDPNMINRYELRVYISESAANTQWQNKYYYYQVTIQTEEV